MKLNTDASFFSLFFSKGSENLFLVPKLNAEIDLRVQATLFSLIERITAGESLVFFENVLRSVRDKLEVCPCLLFFLKKEPSSYSALATISTETDPTKQEAVFVTILQLECGCHP